MIRYVELTFCLLVAVLAIYVLLDASNWALQARLFPLTIGIPLLALAAVQFVRTLRSSPAAIASWGDPDEANQIGFWNPVARREAGRLGFWVLIMLICLALFSFPIGLPLTLLLYLKFESRESWRLSLLLTLATWLYMHVLFDRLLHQNWPDGLVSGPLSDMLARLINPVVGS